ncbi:MAG: hypothetical protein KC729_16315, partial [Candidatus Eisenbacteria bacterium]|nr:hypothetical protein [Candidatus Eisenbacteria bacterium]
KRISISLGSMTALLSVGIASLFLGGTSAHAAADRASLLAAWEELQRADPQVQVFEKLEPGLYQFQTDRFPYDGMLRVLNTSVDDRRSGGYVMGVVEVELVDAPDDFFVKYGQSYSMWQGNNYAYYDPKTDVWKSSAEFTQDYAEDYSCPWYASGKLWYGVLGFLVILVLLLARKANTHIREAMTAQKKVMADHEKAVQRTETAIAISERSLHIAEQQTKLLGEILEELRRSA